MYPATFAVTRPKGSKPQCSHCGRVGHTVEKCFKIHGYPTGSRSRPS